MYFCTDSTAQEDPNRTLSGRTAGSLVRNVWNWLQMVVHRLLGESMGRVSMKVAMLSRQCSIAPPAGRDFLLFSPYDDTVSFTTCGL